MRGVECDSSDMYVFFFQAEDGIRDKLGLEFRRVLFRSGVTGSIARSQTHAQQASGVTLENQHGMVHVLGVGAVEETVLLLAVRRIVGGIDVQQNLAALADLPATETNELIQERIVQMHQAARGRCVFPAAESRLRTERLAQFLIG